MIAHSAFEVSDLTTDVGLRHFAHRVGPAIALMLFDLRLADRLGNAPSSPTDDLLSLRRRLHAALERHVPLHLKDLAINGGDLQRLGIPSGRGLGEILQELLQRVLDDPTSNTPDHLLSVVRCEFARDITAGDI